MNDHNEFHTWLSTRLRDGEIALLGGNAGPRHELWTHHEPVSLFGAWRTSLGAQDVHDVFGWLTERFSKCLSYEFELIASDVIGDMAYTVGLEHSECVTDGEPAKATLRATQIYRREDGEWKVVHRHADAVATP